MSDTYCPVHCDIELVECCSRCLRRRRFGYILFSLAIVAFIVFVPLGDPAEKCTYDANKNDLSLRFTCAVHKFMTRLFQATIEFIGQICQILSKFFEQLFEGPEPKPIGTHGPTNINTGHMSNQTRPTKPVELIKETPPTTNLQPQKSPATSIEPLKPTATNVEPEKPPATNIESHKSPDNIPKTPEKGPDSGPIPPCEEWSYMALKTVTDRGSDRGASGILRKGSSKTLKLGRGSERTLKSSKGSERAIKASRGSDRTLKSGKGSERTLKSSRSSNRALKPGKGSAKSLKSGTGLDSALSLGNVVCSKCLPAPCAPGCPKKK